MSTFSINEWLDDIFEGVASISGATALRLRGTDGMVAPLWEGAGTGSKVGAQGVALGFPTMVVHYNIAASKVT